MRYTGCGYSVQAAAESRRQGRKRPLGTDVKAAAKDKGSAQGRGVGAKRWHRGHGACPPGEGQRPEKAPLSGAPTANHKLCGSFKLTEASGRAGMPAKQGRRIAGLAGHLERRSH